MPVLKEDIDQYREFITAQANTLKCLDVDANQTLWHYTTGEGLIGIVESGTLFATQASCLNDATEVRYGSNLLRDAFLALRQKTVVDAETAQLLDQLETAFLDDDPSNPSHAPSSWFITCFSTEEDDLSQWRGYCIGENGYAIGFRAGGLFGNGLVARVNYDKQQHKVVAEQIADATIRFFRDGLEKERAASPAEWITEFLPAWTNWIGQLAPMVKDQSFSGEKEYRIIHQLQLSEMGRVRFRQRAALMSRHMPLTFPLPIVTRSQVLPIVKVKVGPTRHKAVTRISVDTLLRQMGYGTGLVSVSEIPFQIP
jgi:hypothetical protein